MVNFPVFKSSLLLSTTAPVWMSGVVVARRLGGSGLSNSEIEDRFGTQLQPNEINARFMKQTEASIATRGLQNYDPSKTSVIVDFFSTLGEIDLTYKQVQEICVTMCDSNPNCKAVAVYTPTQVSSLVAHTPYLCKFVNPDVGTEGVFVRNEPNGWRPRPNEPAVVYTKKGVTLPSFDNVACDISTPNLATAITCSLTCPGNPNFDCNECDPSLVTSDFLQYILPAASCIAAEGAKAAANAGYSDKASAAAGVALQDCLGCLTEGTAVVVEFCVDDENSFIREECGDVCFTVEDFASELLGKNGTTLDLLPCEPDLQAALLCSQGGKLELSDGERFGGLVNRDDVTNDFACFE